MRGLVKICPFKKKLNVDNVFFTISLLPIPSEKGQVISFDQTWILFTQEWSSIHIYYVFNNLQLEKGGRFHLNVLKFLSSTVALCQVWLKLDHWMWRRMFKSHLCIAAALLLLPHWTCCSPSFGLACMPFIR